MPAIFLYLVKLSVSLGMVYLFYQLLLRKLTFYNANRWYLVVYTFVCFLVPFINISPVLRDNDWNNNGVVQWVPVIGNYRAATSNWFTAWNILQLVIFAGAFIMLVRLLVQWISFRRMKKQAVLISDGDMRLYQVDAQIIPFSFGNSIFINQHLHPKAELEDIIRHEFIHVKQRHSIDIVWGELICLLNWYNPFAWMLRRAIRQNLEFIADHKVLENGVNKKQYQYLLLKVIGNSQFSIANQFNFSSLKKRIAMMNKSKSARVNLLRFLFALPILAVVLISFREQISDTLSRGNQLSPSSPIFTDTIPEVKTPNKKGYIINIKDNKGTCVVVVKDRNGKEVERLLLSQWNEREDHYEGLYGKIPPPPPPAPPMPPAEPAKPNSEMKVFLKKYPDVKDIAWVYNNNRENKRAIAIIRKKDGTEEKYNLENAEDLARLEKKYGNLPAPPPPPAPPLPPAQVAPIDPEAPVEPAAPVAPSDNSDVVRAIHRAFSTKDISPVALIVVDNTICDKDYLRNLNPSAIKNIVYFNPEEAAKVYGDKGKNGVLRINTVAGGTRMPLQPSLEYLQFSPRELAYKDNC